MPISKPSDFSGADIGPCWSMWNESRPVQEFTSFLRQRPVQLYQDSTGTEDYETQPPGRYDKHLVDRQVLKHVICLPHLATRIGNVVEDELRHLVASNKKLPPVSEQGSFPIKQDRELISENIAEMVFYEEGVIDQYMGATGYPCGIIASTMMLSPRSKTWRSFLTYVRDPPGRTNEGQDGAIADLYLKISTKFKKDDKRLRGALRSSEANMQRWDAVRTHFPALMAFEMKSLLVGNQMVMNEIVRLGNRGPDAVFPWTSCEDPGCKEGHKFSFGRYGRDVLFPNEGILSGTAPESRIDPWYLTMMSPAEQVHDSFSEDETTDDDYDDSADEMGPGFYVVKHPKPVIIIQPDPPGTLENHVKAAQNILQQVWAQAVYIDATFLAIIAGNFEIIGIRHRTTRTLYITEVIEVGAIPIRGKLPYPVPNYKLHTGLYLSVLDDARRRADLIQSHQVGDSDGHPVLPEGWIDTIPPTVQYEPGIINTSHDKQAASLSTPKALNKALPALGSPFITDLGEEESGLRTPRAIHREIPALDSGPELLATTWNSESMPEPKALGSTHEQTSSKRSDHSTRGSTPATDPYSLSTGPIAGLPQRRSTSHSLRPPSIPNSAFISYSQHKGLAKLSESSKRPNSSTRQYSATLPPESLVQTPAYRRAPSPTDELKRRKTSEGEEDIYSRNSFQRRRK